MKTRLLLLLLAGMLAAAPAAGEPPAARQPTKADKCPVCGMFVYKYPDWTAVVLYSEGTAVFFDGAKDLFKYLQDLSAYESERSAEDIAAIYVTEFYDMTLIDARGAFFVSGSDILGPMGNEMIPFKTEGEAAEFMADHKGRRMLRFEQIDRREIQRLE